MKIQEGRPKLTLRFGKRGFALIVTLSLMVLLTLLAVALLSLSSISLRSSSQTRAMAAARANARMAVTLAIGELQKEMGPDMRVSAESALFDQNKDTESIDGMEQSHWLASYNAWGDWLNNTYTLPDGGGTLKISDTYAPKRSKMFRRWLLSLPKGKESDITAPTSLTGWNDANSVVLVGQGSLGATLAKNRPDQVTRAYLTPIEKTGRQAWWIDPQNQKARIDLAKRQRTQGTDAWEVSQGNTAEVGVGALTGYELLDKDATLGDRLVSRDTLRPAQIPENTVKERFFDLTAASQGLLASVRTGQLKRDLSLLFELQNSNLPSPYLFNSGDIREPSIRPMSAELAAKNPTVPNRQFASWTNMRHYYRMYRTQSDATPTEQGYTGSLKWNGNVPYTDFATSTAMTNTNPSWDGSNHYWRAPILTQLTMVYSLKAIPDGSGKYYCRQYYNPVFTFWNPYNTQLVFPSGVVSISCKAYRMWPTSMIFYLDGVKKTELNYGEAKNFRGTLSSGGSGGNIVFQPGEFRVFSMSSTLNSSATGGLSADLTPGFDSRAIAGDERTWTVGKVSTFAPSEKPGVSYEFSCAKWGGGVNNGNTPGAMFIESSMTGGSGNLPMVYTNDWLQRAPHSPDQTNTPITPPGTSNLALWQFDNNPKVVAYTQMAVKGLYKYDYPSINWAKDWRCPNWIQSPPFYFGSGMYMSLNDTTAHTQRLDCPYIVNFGPTSEGGLTQLLKVDGEKGFLTPSEQVNSAAVLELPTAPVGSLAGFANMRINPGWLKRDQYLNRDSPAGQLEVPGWSGNGSNVAKCSLYASEGKQIAYQSGITGPGIGNSFMHPMLPRTDVYRYFDNSKSRDVTDRTNPTYTEEVETQAYCDYWDHAFLLNDALWDDYFVSSLADQTRQGASTAQSLNQNLDRLLKGDPISNTRYRYYASGMSSSAAKTELQATDGYLKAAKHLMVDGMFNVNSTSVAAWQALFAGIRERQLVYRDKSGALKNIAVPSGKRIALSRFDTEVSNQEMDDAATGVAMPDGSYGWSGVRFLDDAQLKKLAEECVKQVKQRGPFLNFSEFINRRLSNDDLGLKGALQSAIDYDNKAPDSKSINYRYKQTPEFMLTKAALGQNSFSTPEASEGSRLAGIPGYVIQSDLLRPIANTLSVRDDTFRIRTYGDALDASGKVVARVWCEAVVQRMPEYLDSANDASVPARLMDASGRFSDNSALKAANRLFGRKFQIRSFRWLNSSEI